MKGGGRDSLPHETAVELGKRKKGSEHKKLPCPLCGEEQGQLPKHLQKCAAEQ